MIKIEYLKILLNLNNAINECEKLSCNCGKGFCSKHDIANAIKGHVKAIEAIAMKEND